jgi:transcriptional regulator with XRE-family HTH domain
MTYEEYCKLRDSYGLTDYAVASLSEVSRATLSQWKNGRSKPSKSTINKIKRLFENYETTMQKPFEKTTFLNPDIAFYDPQSGEKYYIEPGPAINKVSVKLYDGTSCDLSLAEYKQLSTAINAFIFAWIKDKSENTEPDSGLNNNQK